MAGFQRPRRDRLARLSKGVGLIASVAVLSCEATSSYVSEMPALEIVGREAPRDDGTRAAACLGAEAPLTLARGLPHVQLAFGAPSEQARESFLLDFATTSSTLDRSDAPASPRILGTDLTRRTAITIDYARSTVRWAAEGGFCNESELRAEGFTPLSTAGFFANDLSKLRPLTDVVRDAHPGKTVPNVPTVPLRIAGVTAHAQLDTGFDDALVPLSVNINEALLAEILVESPDALVRAPERDLTLTTCTDESEPVQAYAISPGHAVELVAETAQIAKSFVGATVFVKRTPDAARRCGGIGTWTVPAAQVGASFYAALRLVVFDPFGSRVWVR